jgi:hypothetical protein
MTWQEGIAVLLVVTGLLAGGYVAAQRPAFWIEFGARLFRKLWPLVFRYFSKRMSPEEEAEYQKAFRAGRGAEWLRRRGGQPPKG